MEYYRLITEHDSLSGRSMVTMFDYIFGQLERDPEFAIEMEFSDLMIGFLIKGKSRSYLYNVIVKNQDNVFPNVVRFIEILFKKYGTRDLQKKIMALFNVMMGIDVNSSPRAVEFVKFLIKSFPAKPTRSDYKVSLNAYLEDKQDAVPNDDFIPELDPSKLFEGMARKQNMATLMKFLDEHPTLIPSNQTLNNIYPNGHLTWEEADELLNIFLKRNFKPNFSNLINLKYDGDMFVIVCVELVTRGDEKIFEQLVGLPAAINVMVTTKEHFDLSLEKFHVFLEKVHYADYNTLLGLFNRVNGLANEKTLRLLCMFECPDLIEQICASAVVKPDQICLHNSCLKAVRRNNVRKLYNYKLFVDEQCFYNVVNVTGSFNDDVKFLVEYGFLLNLKHVEYALERGLVLEGLDIYYGIPYDEKLYEICYRLNNFPVAYMNAMGATYKEIMTFRKMFLTFTDANIRKFMKNNPSLVVDEYCYGNALKNKNNLASFMVEYGYNPSLKDIMKIKDEDKRMSFFYILYERQKIELM
ncbi:MAG: hypothetical protein Harvfovirus66_1 [Harvfovirus sp.]|uniref:Uncharacterized protein n=1 Tax=Harvfovirus sp. TaxID=2487768 RepID=A0A3G5A3Q8_9VIRU|nr:MAG: hypothetical protein Harvfovirus66_1 [Harvfovirus sp.]